MSDSNAQYVAAVSTQLNNVPQQMQSKLQDAVVYDPAYSDPGTAFYLDDRGTTDPKEATSKGGRIEPRELQGFRRGGYFEADQDWFYEFDEDRVAMLLNPLNTDVQSLMAGKERKKDWDIINKVMLGTTYKASGSQTNAPLDTPVVFPSSQIILDDNRDDLHDDEALKVAASGPLHLTVGKLITAGKMLDGSLVDGQKFVAVDEFAIANLLASTPTTSAYYSDVKALNSGKVDEFLGFRFKKFANKTGILPGYVATGSLAATSYVAWLDKGVHYNERAITNVTVAKDITVEGHPTQVYYKRQRAGARRYEDAVVQINCTRLRRLAS